MAFAIFVEREDLGFDGPFMNNLTGRSSLHRAIYGDIDDELQQILPTDHSTTTGHYAGTTSGVWGSIIVKAIRNDVAIYGIMIIWKDDWLQC